MKNKRIVLRFTTIAILILTAAFSRLIPHPANFAPIGAMALFGAAYFKQRHWAFIIPVLSMWLSDIFINNVIYGEFFGGFVWFYPGFYFTYAAFLIIGLIGIFTLKKVKVQNIIISGLLASVIFFLVSNFGVWMSTTMYPKDIAGLVTCYTAGLPFFKNTLLGDMVYCAVLFGAFEFAQYKIPQLKHDIINN